MTVSTETASVSYSGNGITVSWAVPYYILESSHVRVTLRSSLGVESVKALTTDYTVANAGTNPSTATVTAVSFIPATGETLLIERDVPATQETDLVENDSLPAESVEKVFDKLTMLYQQLSTAISRALRLPASSPVSSQLAEPSAGQIPRVNSTETGIDWVDYSVSVPADADFIVVSNVATMKALTGLVGGEIIKTSCYSVAGKGAGTYRASTTVVTENGGTKINNNAGTITYHLIHDGRVDITQFGALVDNSTNDHVAIQACLDAADSEDFTPTHNGGVSRIAAKLTVPAFVKFKGHGNFRKNGNIDMCELANGACVEDISWDGRGATYTGRGIIVSAQGDQKIHDCDITDMDGYCVEFVGNGTAPGIRSTIRGGVQYRTNVSDPAIKYPDDVLNGNRSMVDIHSAGGVLADFGGGENILVYGCNTDNFDYSDAPRKVALVCNRIATSGANLIIDGQEHITVGNLIAGQVELTSGTNNCVIGPDVSIGALIDNSGVSNNKVYGHYAEFTPVWEAATTNPTLGNGTITGRMTRDGRRANFVIELTMGSTTTFGTGAYSFKLPSPYDAWTVRRSIGNVRALDSGTNFRTGVAITVTGVFSVSLYSDAGTAAWGPTNPFTFAVNDTIIIDVDCELT